MKIAIKKPKSFTAIYRPWKLGDALIRENDDSVKLWRFK